MKQKAKQNVGKFAKWKERIDHAFTSVAEPDAVYMRFEIGNRTEKHVLSLGVQMTEKETG